MLQYENFVVYKSFNNIIKIDKNNCSTKLLENKNLKRILKFKNKLLILTTKLLYLYDFESIKPIYAVKDLKIKHLFINETVAHISYQQEKSIFTSSLRFSQQKIVILHARCTL